MKSLVSVIVPVYNTPIKLIDKCIYSIINQTYSNLEIIIVDDGSKKNISDYIDNIAKIDNRILVFHQKNAGLSYARNTGVKYSKGQILSFVDSDDFIEKDMIELMAKSIIEDSCDIVCCGIKFIDNEHAINREWFNEKRILEKKEAMYHLLKDEKITSAAWSKIYKKDLIINHPFPDGKIFEDAYIMHEVFDEANKVGIVNMHLYNYYLKNDSITHTLSIVNYIDQIKIWIRRYEYVDRHYPEYGYITAEKIVKKIYKLSKRDIDLQNDKREYLRLVSYIKTKDFRKNLKQIKIKIMYNYLILKEKP